MIIKLLEWILGIELSLCKHDFYAEKEIEAFRENKNGENEKLPYKIVRSYLCKKCGKHKIIQFK